MGEQSASVKKLNGLSSQVLLSLAGWIRSFGNCSSAVGGIFNRSGTAYSTTTAQVGTLLLIYFVRSQEICLQVHDINQEIVFGLYM